MTEIVWGLSGVNVAEAARRQKPKAISYTGCWTCRERHVKCDERPEACRNCERSKYVCAGYGLRLRWPTDKQGSRAGPVGRRRQTVGLKRQRKVPPQASWATPGIGTFSDESPSANSPQSLLSTPEILIASPPKQHPSVQTPKQVELCSPTQPHHEGVSPLADGSTAIEYSFSSCRSSSTPSCEICPTILPSTIAFCAGTPDSCPTTYLPDIVSGQSVDLLDPVIELVPSQHHGQPGHGFKEQSLLWSSALLGGSPSQAIHDMPLITFGDSATTLLLYHYTNYMVSLMQPVSHHNNPFKNIYLRLALGGCQALQSSQTSSQNSLARISVFHSVLASAAVNLRSLTLDQASYFYQLACYHRREALKAARDALADKSSSYKELMTAILSLVSVDIVDGGMHDHWIHLEAATKLRNSQLKSRVIGLQTRQLNAMCKMLGLFARTALYEPDGTPWPGFVATTGDTSFDDLWPSIEFIYGITPFLAKAILKNHELASYLAYYKKDYPESLVEACEAFHDELLSWTIDSEAFSTINADDGPALVVAKAQATAFYNATLIYHYRTIQQCERQEQRKEQKEVLQAMNQAEDLKAQSRRLGYWAAPITWPAFISSCEAVGEERKQWAMWWDRVQRYGLANYAGQKSLIHQIWARQDDEECKTDWREILFDMNVRIIPV